jgi:hypothetical protein
MIVVLSGWVLVIWMGFGPATNVLPAEDDPTRVLTDTPAYCLQLQLMIEDVLRQATTPPPWGVAMLAADGERLCEQGQVHGGVIRLRRALVLLGAAPSGKGD